uniref:Carboxylesterase n=1 Tax=Opuntia streptacantha TaxID=393608 RepID=A0A7C9CXL6_OPUST
MSSNAEGLSLKSKLQWTALLLINGIACRRDGTVNRRLISIADVKSRPSATPIGGVKSFDRKIDPSRKLWFRLFVPVDAESQPSLPVLIYFHGGGFVCFSPRTTPFDTLCRRLAASIPAVVVSINYRHAPEHRCPSQYEDGFDVLEYIDRNKNEIDGFPANADLTRCFLAGDSAGGNLAHHVAVRWAESEFKAVRIRGLVAIQPFFGGEERTDSELRWGKNTRLPLKRTDFYWKAFLPVGSDRDDPASNVFGPKSKDLSGLNFPPTLVVVGGKDLLQDWQRRYCEGLKRSGKEVELVEYPNVQHGFYSSPELPEFSMLVAHIREFLQKQQSLAN